MATTGSYALGLTSGSAAWLDYPPKSVFKRSILGLDLNGAPVLSSFAEVEWSWEELPQAGYETLYSTWELSLSGTNRGEVYFVTRHERGTPDFTYGQYRGRMQRPESEVGTFIDRSNVRVQFLRVEAV